MRHALLLGIVAVLGSLVIGCGRVPAFRVLETDNQDGFVEMTVLTEAATARDVRRVIDAAVSGARRQFRPDHVTVYVVDTETYIGVVYDVAVAYWDRALPWGHTRTYLREKVVNPGSVPRPTPEELAYYGIMHRLWFNRSDLVLPEEQAFYDQFSTSHSQAELDEMMVRVQRWLFQ